MAKPSQLCDRPPIRERPGEVYAIISPQVGPVVNREFHILFAGSVVVRRGGKVLYLAYGCKEQRCCLGACSRSVSLSIQLV